jgi:predicted transcriptional regulator
MSKNICDIMQRNVIVAHVDDSIEEVEIFITNNKLSFLPIVDSDNVCFGVISDSDILKFHRNKGDVKLEHAWEICSHSVIETNGDLSITEAAKLLVDNKVHHLVIAKDNVISGVVSSIDLLRHFIDNDK